jgi:hypothetical protein
MELQQSPLYATYIHSLGWTILRVGRVQMFFKHIPLVGGLLKIQRPRHLPPIKQLIPILKKYHVRTVAIEPHPKENLTVYKRWCKQITKHCKVIRSSYQPTKTIFIDVTSPEDNIFSRLTDAKRRAVRKAIKNGVTVEESSDIRNLIKIKNKSGGAFGFITTFGMDRFWPIMTPDHATVLLAYTDSHKLVGGILLLGKNRILLDSRCHKTGKEIICPDTSRVGSAEGCKKTRYETI